MRRLPDVSLGTRIYRHLREANIAWVSKHGSREAKETCMRDVLCTAGTKLCGRMIREHPNGMGGEHSSAAKHLLFFLLMFGMYVQVQQLLNVNRFFGNERV